MLDDAIILSIQPKYSKLVFSGKKTVELRKQCPRRIKEGVLVLLYVTSPVKALEGAFVVEKVLKAPLEELWESVKERLALSHAEFLEYYGESNEGVAVFFSKLWKLSNPVELCELRDSLTSFIPPQSFRYASSRERRYLVRRRKGKLNMISGGEKP